MTGRARNFQWQLAIAALAIGALVAASAHAAGGGDAAGTNNDVSTTEAIFFLQIVVLLVVGRLLGEVMQRLGQPPIMGQLLAGIALGPSLFGAIAPELQKMVFPSNVAQKSMMDAVSQLGILMLLLLTGMETDLKLVKKVGGKAIAISLAGVVCPFVCGCLLAQFLPDSLLPEKSGRLVPALFLGTALSISSVKIVAMVVREMKFMRRDLGQIIVASAIIEDTVGWVIIAATLGIATKGTLDLASLTKIILGVGIFLIASFTVGRQAVFILIRWANDNFRSEFPVITMILIIMSGMALITQYLGVNTVLGAFVAGILIGESPILTQHIEEQLRGLITALFMPIFFGLAGLSANLRVLADPTMLGLTAALVLVASLGKFTGAFAGAAMSGLRRQEALALGCAMNARGSTEVIVATIGLSMGALTQNLFTMIVTMAVVTTTIMPPMLRSALSNLPFGKEERARIAREELDEKGFVSKLERLLLAVDESPAGRFASRIGGLIAGTRGMPTTIFEQKSKIKAVHRKKSNPEMEQEVKGNAEASAELTRKTDTESNPAKVHVTSREHAEDHVSAVTQEAQKGYSLLIVGRAKSHDAEGVFSGEISDIVTEFDGPAIVVAGAEGVPQPDMNNGTRILVPVNGSEISRHAAEVAFALARPTGATVLALFVSMPVGKDADTHRRRRKSAAVRRNEEVILKDITRLGERYDVALQTAIKSHGSPDHVILEEAARCSLIVMGVDRRPGEKLFFGNTAHAILRERKGVTVFVVS